MSVAATPPEAPREPQAWVSSLTDDNPAEQDIAHLRPARDAHAGFLDLTLMATSPWSPPQPDFIVRFRVWDSNFAFLSLLPAKCLVRLILGVARDTMAGYYAADGGS
jgi:hypothetical protein